MTRGSQVQVLPRYFVTIEDRQASLAVFDSESFQKAGAVMV